MNTQKQKEKDWIIREKYNGQEKPDLIADLKRLELGEPVAYIIGFVDFLNCKIDLSFKPLIPRPETEYWVEQIINKLKKDSKTEIKCLDIFAGSGCVGIALLKNLPAVKMVFMEKSERFCEQIAKNLKLNDIPKERYEIIRSNVFRPVSGEVFTDQFDYILANPPYIPLDRKDKLDKSVTDWEPPEALFAKDNGLFLIKRFIAEVKKYLKPAGLVCLEFDVSQNLVIKDLLVSSGFSSHTFYKDQYSRWRYVIFGI